MSKKTIVEERPTLKGLELIVVQDQGISARGRCIEDVDDGVTVEAEIKGEKFAIICMAPFIRQIWIKQEEVKNDS